MSMVKHDMHGLSLFISDIRNCKCPEDEIKRVNKELANIRSKFNGDKTLDGYGKKKYLCKLIYMFLLGHEFNIGILEAINLVSSNKYTEKFIGYLFLSVIINEKSNLMILVHNAVKNDLLSRNPVHQKLALQYAANMASENLVNNISKDVLQILFHSDTTDDIKQSAILCLLRILRIQPEAFFNEDCIQRIVCLISHPNLGIVTAVTSLLELLAEKGKLDGYPCVSNVVSKLHRLVKATYIDLKDYGYYFVPAPWVTVKLLRLLRNFSVPPESVVKSRLIGCIELILNKCQEPLKSKRAEHKNARSSVMFETIFLISHLKLESHLYSRACYIVEHELLRKEYNLRYLAIDAMCFLSDYDAAKDRLKLQLGHIQESLYFKDISIRQRASDLLFLLCDENNVEEIIQDLFNHLQLSDPSDREESALKIAYLAEQFYDHPTWYVDIILRLLQDFGAYTKDEICHTLIQNVIEIDSLHSYAPKRMFDILQTQTCNENLIKVAGYILGEFGNLIAGDPIYNSTSQLQMLQKYFRSTSLETKAFLLTTYIKFFNLFPDLKEDIKKIFETHTRHSNIEIQQRAVEYLKLMESTLLNVILEEIPYTKTTKSTVLIAIQKIRPGIPKTLKVRRNDAKKSNMPTRSISEKVPNKGSDIQEERERAQTTVLQSNIDMKTKSYCEVLANIFSNPKSNVNYAPLISPILDIQNADKLNNHIWENNGTLFENEFFQVTTESVFNQHVGRISLRYRNKTMDPFRNFLPRFLYDDKIKWKLQMKPCVSVIFASGQTVQEIEVECLQEFSQRPALSVGFDCFDTYCELPLKLPITLNKFFEPVTMDTEGFQEKWANLNFPHQHLQKVLNALYPINSIILIKKLSGMGMAVQSTSSQDREMVLCSGIFHCRAYQIGFLCILQLQKENKQYCLTMRASRNSILEELARLIECLI